MEKYNNRGFGFVFSSISEIITVLELLVGVKGYNFVTTCKKLEQLNILLFDSQLEMLVTQRCLRSQLLLSVITQLTK